MDALVPASPENISDFLHALRRNPRFSIETRHFFRAKELYQAVHQNPDVDQSFHTFGQLLAPIVCRSSAEQDYYKRFLEEWAPTRETEARDEGQTKTASSSPEQEQHLQQVKSDFKRSSRKVSLIIGIIAGLVAGALHLSGGLDLSDFLSTTNPTDPVVDTPPATDGTPPDQTTDGKTPGSGNGTDGSFWLVLGLLAAPYLVLVRRRSQRRSRREAWLGQGGQTAGHEKKQLKIEATHRMLFGSPTIRRAILNFRNFIRTQTSNLDSRQTALQTAAAGGRFVPAYQTMLASPGYIALVDTSTYGEHTTHFFKRLIDTMRSNDMSVITYYFHGDPRVCQDENEQKITLKNLARQHGGERLLLFSSGDFALNDLVNRPEEWVERNFAAWPTRAVVTPKINPPYGLREWCLQQTGFAITPATTNGIDRLADLMDKLSRPDEDPGPLRSSSAPLTPLPAQLQTHDDIHWVSSYMPDSKDIEELVAQLKDFLGRDGFDWLCGCAVFPALVWEITAYIGHQIAVSKGQTGPDEDLLLKIIGLPWFRHGRMPNYMRVRLAAELSEQNKVAVMAALENIIAAKLDPTVDSIDLDLSLPADATERRLMAAHIQSKDGPEDLRDGLLLKFLEGRKPARSDYKLPEKVAEHLSLDDKTNKKNADLLVASIVGLVSWTMATLYVVTWPDANNGALDLITDPKLFPNLQAMLLGGSFLAFLIYMYHWIRAADGNPQEVYWFEKPVRDGMLLKWSQALLFLAILGPVVLQALQIFAAWSPDAPAEMSAFAKTSSDPRASTSYLAYFLMAMVLLPLSHPRPNKKNHAYSKNLATHFIITGQHGFWRLAWRLFFASAFGLLVASLITYALQSITPAYSDDTQDFLKVSLEYLDVTITIFIVALGALWALRHTFPLGYGMKFRLATAISVPFVLAANFFKTIKEDMMDPAWLAVFGSTSGDFNNFAIFALISPVVPLLFILPFAAQFQKEGYYSVRSLTQNTWHFAQIALTLLAIVMLSEAGFDLIDDELFVIAASFTGLAVLITVMLVGPKAWTNWTWRNLFFGPTLRHTMLTLLVYWPLLMLLYTIVEDSTIFPSFVFSGKTLFDWDTIIFASSAVTITWLMVEGWTRPYFRAETDKVPTSTTNASLVMPFMFALGLWFSFDLTDEVYIYLPLSVGLMAILPWLATQNVEVSSRTIGLLIFVSLFSLLVEGDFSSGGTASFGFALLGFHVVVGALLYHFVDRPAHMPLLLQTRRMGAELMLLILCCFPFFTGAQFHLDDTMSFLIGWVTRPLLPITFLLLGLTRIPTVIPLGICLFTAAAGFGLNSAATDYVDLTDLTTLTLASRDFTVSQWLAILPFSYLSGRLLHRKLLGGPDQKRAMLGAAKSIWLVMFLGIIAAPMLEMPDVFAQSEKPYEQAQTQDEEFGLEEIVDTVQPALRAGPTDLVLISFYIAFFLLPFLYGSWARLFALIMTSMALALRIYVLDGSPLDWMWIILLPAGMLFYVGYRISEKLFLVRYWLRQTLGEQELRHQQDGFTIWQSRSPSNRKAGQKSGSLETPTRDNNEHFFDFLKPYRLPVMLYASISLLAIAYALTLGPT